MTLGLSHVAAPWIGWAINNLRCPKAVYYRLTKYRWEPDLCFFRNLPNKSLTSTALMQNKLIFSYHFWVYFKLYF